MVRGRPAVLSKARRLRWGLLLAAVLVGPAHAGSSVADPSWSLPTLALVPAPPPSVWTGLYAGTEVVGVARRGARGAIGGDVYGGYDRAFGNGVVLGASGSTGYAPSLWGGRGVAGVDYGIADLRVGYDMGRLLPFVTAGLALERPHLGPGTGFGTETVNTLLNGPGDLRAATRVGVGALYQVTPSLTVGVALSAFGAAGPAR